MGCNEVRGHEVGGHEREVMRGEGHEVGCNEGGRS